MPNRCGRGRRAPTGQTALSIGPLLIGTVLAGTLPAGPAAGEEPFRLFELPGPGRVVSAGIADLDGDGRGDIWALSIYGVPPDSRRELRVHFQEPDGSFGDEPGWAGSAVDGAGAYEIADLPDGPGEELLLLRRDRVSVLSFTGRTLTKRDLVIPGDPTIAAAPDERGLDRYRMVREEVGPNLLVPGLGEIIVLTPEGQVLSRPAVGARANYFIPDRPGPLVGESEIESYYDFAHVETGDVDGDGLGDLITSTRHELRVFRQRPDGSFPREPDQRHPFRRLDEKDQIRGSGNVRMASGDFNGDGRADLLVTSTTGGLLNARSQTTFHLNRDGTWKVDEPDGSFLVEGSWSALQLLDLDGDGRPELVEARVALTVLELVEFLLQRSIDMQVSYFETGPDGVFRDEPKRRSVVSVGVNLDTFTQKGFIPTLSADMNGDGLPDRVASGDGEAVEVYLGGGKDPQSKRAARQEMDTRGSIRFGDLDGDGLDDFLLFDRTRPDTELRIAVNQGRLPGSRRRSTVRSAER
jgi:hypothetical protein